MNSSPIYQESFWDEENPSANGKPLTFARLLDTLLCEELFRKAAAFGDEETGVSNLNHGAADLMETLIIV